MKTKNIKFHEAINLATRNAMRDNPNVICYGLGVTDPKGVFGTTLGLVDEFGTDRVFDVPCSENALTGIGIGCSLLGIRPLMVHQRLDFFLLAMDQLVNSAAKWHFMFGGVSSVPITIRLIIGRGWGQGPTHSQNLQSWFAHIPGLKVIAPSSAVDAYHMLREAIDDPNPVIILEHRWLHNSESPSIPEKRKVNFGQAEIVSRGTDITIAATSYMVPEALYAAKYLLDNLNISAEIIDLRFIKPIDWETLFRSVRKTKKLLTIENSAVSFSVSSEITATVAETLGLDQLSYLGRMGLPDIPEPTSYGLTKHFYNDYSSIIKVVTDVFDIAHDFNSDLLDRQHHDIPGEWFRGPF